MSDRTIARFQKTIDTLQDLIAELSCALTDEGDGGWSTDGLHNIRVRTANALPPGKRPDWLNAYADPRILRS